MRFGVVLALASSFFKSYFRSSSQKGPTLFFSKPKVMVGIDVALFFAPAFILQFLMGAIPVDYSGVLSPLVVRALVSLPLLITSAVIVSGLMFELGQGSAISSSEAVNWWPISPREYVAASALSTSSLYSAFLALAAGVTLPLAIKFGLFYAWPVVILLSAIALFLGAFIVELLKSSVNRVSSVAYKKSGRLTLAVRLIVLVFLFAIVQLAFQPAALSWFFGSIAGGVEVVWMVPFVWSSAAITSLLNYDVVLTVVYVLFSFLFTVVLYELSCQLRSRYWSPVPISITIDESTGYFPQSSIGKGFGLDSLASLLALKEFRALTRRKDLARFIAIPIMIAVGILAPVIASPGTSGRGPGFFLAAMIPFLVPLMFATISIGQEGVSITHLLCLPVKPNDLIKGKLAPAWLISSVMTVAMMVLMEFFAPLGLDNALAIGVVLMMAVIINSFIGLGVGARWPDYTVGARSRFISMKGFIVGFALSGISTLALYVPMVLYVVNSTASIGGLSFMGLTLLFTLTISAVLGCVLIVLSYIYCKKGVENLLSNM